MAILIKNCSTKLGLLYDGIAIRKEYLVVPFDYATAHLSAIWRLGFSPENSKDAWRDMIDRSVDGVFKSFWAMVYAAPFAALSFTSTYKVAPQVSEAFRSPLFEAPFPILFLVLFLTYGLTWIINIAIMAFVASRAGYKREVSDLVICYNWAQVPILAIQAIPITLAALSQATASFGFLLAVAGLCMVMILYWRIFRRSLGAGIGLTIALLSLLLIVNVIIGNVLTAFGMSFV